MRAPTPPAPQYRSVQELGDIIRNTWTLYTSNFRTLFLIALITAPLQMLGAIVARQVSDDDAAATLSALIQIPVALVGLIAIASIVFAVGEIADGRETEPGPAIDVGFSRFGAIFTTSLLEGVLIVASLFSFPALAIWWLIKRDATIDGRRNWWLLLPLVLPVYLLGRWIMAGQAVVAGGQARWSALDASAGAVRYNWWRVLGILLVVGLLLVGPLLVASASAALPPLAEATIASGISALVLPFSVTAQTLLYFDLQARRNDAASPA